jgi:hypothetical protein
MLVIERDLEDYDGNWLNAFIKTKIFVLIVEMMIIQYEI